MKKLLLVAIALIGLGACGQPNSPDGSPSTASAAVKQKATFKAVIIRKDGSQAPVADTKFLASPFSILRGINVETELESFSFKTNLDGEADLELEPGEWFFSADFQGVGFRETSFEVKAETKRIEISRKL